MLALFCLLISCAVTRDRDKLVDYKSNEINTTILKLDGYFYREYESEISEYNIVKTGITKAKTLDVIFIYEDGFSYFLSGIDGLTHFYCAEGNSTHLNSFESAHTNVNLMIEAQNSDIKKTKELCDFEPNNIDRKGLTKMENGKIKIQYYRTDIPRPTRDSFLYEMNGIIENPETFLITEIKNYKNNSTENVNLVYKFRRTNRKPEIPNYFKKSKI